MGGQASAECPLPVIGAFIVVASITQTGTAITASRFFHLSGWHIILVEEKRIAEAPTIEELAPQLRQNLISQNLGRLLDSLRTNARIERRPFADIRLEAQASSAN